MYSVFLSALARYLAVKAESGQVDSMYAYGVAAFLRYAEWMLDNEVPYFDRPEMLELPTETWAAQELRKANVLRLAAKHADEPLRSRLLRRGEELADRGWHDLRRFDSHDVTRAIAITMIEGTRDAYFRSRDEPPAPKPPSTSFPPKEKFVSRRDRVLARAKTLRGSIGIVLALANPRSWPKIIRSIRYRI